MPQNVCCVELVNIELNIFNIEHWDSHSLWGNFFLPFFLPQLTDQLQMNVKESMLLIALIIAILTDDICTFARWGGHVFFSDSDAQAPAKIKTQEYLNFVLAHRSQSLKKPHFSSLKHRKVCLTRWISTGWISIPWPQ